MEYERALAECYRSVEMRPFLYPVAPDQSVRVPNARRIEALCHAGLAESSVMIYCHGCLRQRTEWLEVASGRVQEVVQ